MNKELFKKSKIVFKGKDTPQVNNNKSGRDDYLLVHP
jgi:hypothetical protein